MEYTGIVGMWHQDCHAWWICVFGYCFSELCRIQYQRYVGIVFTVCTVYLSFKSLRVVEILKLRIGFLH